MALEREVKLRFESRQAARDAIDRIDGVRILRSRRLQHDALLDSVDGRLYARRSAVRVRADGPDCVLTYKGPPQPDVMKVREEYETRVGDAPTAFRILDELGYQVIFRYEKYREEFGAASAILAIDETPIGVFVEIEGSEQDVARLTLALGRTPQDYVTASYRALYLEECHRRGDTPRDMLFPA